MISFTALGLLFLDPLLLLFGASKTALYARDYLGVIVLGAVFQIVGFGLNAMHSRRGEPEDRHGDDAAERRAEHAPEPLFLFGFHWG